MGSNKPSRQGRARTPPLFYRRLLRSGLLSLDCTIFPYLAENNSLYACIVFRACLQDVPTGDGGAFVGLTLTWYLTQGRTCDQKCIMGGIDCPHQELLSQLSPSVSCLEFLVINHDDSTTQYRENVSTLDGYVAWYVVTNDQSKTVLGP